VWQGIYEELKDKNFIIISIALDIGGVSAVEAYIRSATSQLSPEILGIMGWEETLSNKAAMPAYPCLIDEKHTVAELYNIVNVPTAVWIDESGRIVRPAEPAGATDGFRKMDRATRQLPAEVAAAGTRARRRYVDAIRDWVEKGDASVYALSPDEIRRRGQVRAEHEILAAANFRLGQHLYQQGHRQTAKYYFAEAIRLHPENWSFKRQSWELEELGKAFGPDFWATVDALGEKPYYPPIDL